LDFYKWVVEFQTKWRHRPGSAPSPDQRILLNDADCAVLREKFLVGISIDGSKGC
jgi:sulfatase maturation enzyme AslB (radical SAM superfamily)